MATRHPLLADFGCFTLARSDKVRCQTLLYVLRFRPLSSKEIGDLCVRGIDPETFVFQDDKEDEFTFSLDRVFYEESAQAAVYDFLALPIMRGAGKTYSMEGPGIQDCDEHKKGFLPRVVDGMFDQISSPKILQVSQLNCLWWRSTWRMDLLDLSKGNIQIKENKTQGILLSGVTEVHVSDSARHYNIYP